MIRFISLSAVVSLVALFAGACSEEDTTTILDSSLLPLSPAGAGGGAARDEGTRAGVAPGTSAGGPSAGTSGGAGASGAGAAGVAGGAAAAAAGSAGAGGTGAAAGAGPDSAPPDPEPAPLDADAGAAIPCVESADCDDENDCTDEACVGGVCRLEPSAIGTPCGDTTAADECTQPDTCDGFGVCLANDQPDGTPCAEGHCSPTGTCDCAVERIVTVPYEQQWQTTAVTEVDLLDLQPCQVCDNTPDHVVVFTAPADGLYRFSANSVGGGAELALFEGDCTGTPSDLACGEDIDPTDDVLDEQLDRELSAGDTVSVVLGEQCEENGGTGTLRIELAPEEP